MTTILCIGPFLESTPRPRFYALDLKTGEIVSASSQVGTGQATAGGASSLAPRTPHRNRRRRHRLRSRTADGQGWSLSFPGEEVHDVAPSGDSVYVYVATPGAAGEAGGRILKVDADSGATVRIRSLSEDVAVGDGTADIAASDDAVVVGAARTSLSSTPTGTRSGPRAWSRWARVGATPFLGQSNR